MVRDDRVAGTVTQRLRVDNMQLSGEVHTSVSDTVMKSSRTAGVRSDRGDIRCRELLSDIECKGCVAPRTQCSSVDPKSVVGLSTSEDESIPVPGGKVRARYVAGQRSSRVNITRMVSSAPLRSVGFIAPRSLGGVQVPKQSGGGGRTSSSQH